MEHLSPQRRRLRAVGAGEIVEHARGRVLEQAVPERLEAIDDLFDQRPDTCCESGQQTGGSSILQRHQEHLQNGMFCTRGQLQKPPPGRIANRS